MFTAHKTKPTSEYSDRIKHYWLYVLRLDQDKYYIGITSRHDPYERINEHFKGFYTAQWLKKYKPVEQIEIIDIGNINKSTADELELHRTLQYMKKYGYQNVRGGILNYSGKYVKIGNYFWRGWDFELLVAFVLLMAALVYEMIYR